MKIDHPAIGSIVLHYHGFIVVLDNVIPTVLNLDFAIFDVRKQTKLAKSTLQFKVPSFNNLTVFNFFSFVSNVG